MSNLTFKFPWNILLVSIPLLAVSLINTENVFAANIEKQKGNVRAEVSFQKGEYSQAKNVRIKILRDKKQVFSEIVSPMESDYSLDLSIQDLDGDGEAEIIFTHNPALGTRCCNQSQIYFYKKSSNTYSKVIGEWKGAGGPPKIKDIDGDGKYEFEYIDWRFAYAFTSFADSVMPIRIWQYRDGYLSETTSKYPQAIRRNIKEGNVWHQQLVRDKRDLKGSFAAYVAEKNLLGEGKEGFQEIQKNYKGPDKQEFLDKLKDFLRKTGYTSLPSK
jgi:hypothetical protein